MFEVCQQTCLQIEQYLKKMREAVEFTCTITLIWQLLGPIIKQLQLHPTPPLIGIPDESALFERQTFRLNDSLPFYSKPSKHLMIKNPKKKFVSLS